MATKTVLKLLLSKYAPLSVEMQKAVISDQAVIHDAENDTVEYVDNDEVIQDAELVAEKKEYDRVSEFIAGSAKRKRRWTNWWWPKITCTLPSYKPYLITLKKRLRDEHQIQPLHIPGQSGRKDHFQVWKADPRRSNTPYRTILRKNIGVRKEITSKYFEKGVINEIDGVELLNRTLHPHLFLSKKKPQPVSKRLCARVKLIETKEIIYDIKNAWDQFTFEKAEMTWDYEWQLRAYMWLWNKHKARLFYCLTQMPDHLIEAEAKRYWYREKLDIHNPEGLEMEDVLTAFYEKYDFSKLPDEEIQGLGNHHEEEKIEQMQDAVWRA